VRWFFVPFGHILECDLGSEFFSVFDENRRNRIDFMSIGAFSMFGKNTLGILLILFKGTVA
jgi:hypothetical protein